MLKYEITFVETGRTVRWTEAEAITYFGAKEWPEFLAGYLPHVVVTEL